MLFCLKMQNSIYCCIKRKEEIRDKQFNCWTFIRINFLKESLGLECIMIWSHCCSLNIHISLVSFPVITELSSFGTYLRETIMNGKKKSSEINHKPEHLPKCVVNIFWSYLSETKVNIKRRPLSLFDSMHCLYMRYFSYHMFLLTFRNQFIAFCIWYLCHVTKVVNPRKLFPSYSYLEPNCRWLKISPNVSIREKCQRKPPRFFSTCTNYEILWKVCFSFSKFKISLPEACRCFAKEENDWTFQSVQSEFHRMLVSSKSISQSRNVATVHFTSPRIFTTYWIF